MKLRFLRILGVCVALTICAGVALVVVLPLRDSYARRNLLGVITSELRVGASQDQMTDFLRRHTSRFALDDVYRHEYGGYVPQTALDRILFDRQVQIVFKLNADGSMKEAHVWVFYTAL
jgi:hypothetical protein